MDGLDRAVPAALERFRRGMEPINRARLTDRLTALGMVMAPNRAPAEATVWLAEMARLLSDVPEDILCRALDDLMRTLKFLPTLSEIREKVDPAIVERGRLVAQMDAVNKLIEEGVTDLPLPRRFSAETQTFDESQRCTPEQAAAIMKEFGLRRNPLDIAQSSGAH